ncbi:hypothetical protein GQ607_014308, partial [Colletotrichum asianum]
YRNLLVLKIIIYKTLNITLIEKVPLLKKVIKNSNILSRNKTLNLKNKYIKNLRKILKKILTLKKFKNFKKNLILFKLLLILLLPLLEDNKNLNLIPLLLIIVPLDSLSYF